MYLWQIDSAVVDDDSYGSNVDTVDSTRGLGNYGQYGNSDGSDIDNDDGEVTNIEVSLMLNTIDGADVDDVGNLVDYHHRWVACLSVTCTPRWWD